MTQLPTSLSVIILCHRYDDRLLRAITSVSWADEVMLLDTNHLFTQQIPPAQKNVGVLSMPQTSHTINFGQLRNTAIEKAKNDWVFFLDSDEYLPPEAKTAVSALLQQAVYNGYLFNRIDIFYGRRLRWGEAGHMQLLRLGRKHLMHYIRPVHEIATISGNIGHATLPIYHQPHQSLHEFIQKITYYAQLEAQYRSRTQQIVESYELLLFPTVKFLYTYIFLLGILDGWRGFCYSFVMSLHSLLVRIYYYEIQQNNRQPS